MIHSMNEKTEKLVAMLAKRGKKLTTAESCTGGMIASEITSVPGASHVFEGGFITYSERLKEKMLGVSAGLISRVGVVSEDVARDMADGALRRSDADIAVAVTGFAGPTGGTKEAPVGTVWFAVAAKEGAFARSFRFDGNREAVREQAVEKAIELLTEGTELYL